MAEREPTSEFGKKLRDNLELAERCKKIADAIREAARADIEAGERAERITAEDLAVVINARSDARD